jgi:hypothetical protein
MTGRRCSLEVGMSYEGEDGASLSVRVTTIDLMVDARGGANAIARLISNSASTTFPGVRPLVRGGSYLFRGSSIAVEYLSMGGTLSRNGPSCYVNR